MRGKARVVTYFIKSLERDAAVKCFPNDPNQGVREWKVSFFPCLVTASSHSNLDGRLNVSVSIQTLVTLLLL